MALLVDTSAFYALGDCLVDATSFVLIERLGIEEALSLDAHYRVVRLGRRKRALTVWP